MKDEKTISSLIFIQPDGSFTISDADAELLRITREMIRTYYLIVCVQRPAPALVRALPADWNRLILLVPEESENMPFNLYSSWLVGYPEPLAGSAVVMRWGLDDDGVPDFLPLTAFQQRKIRSILQSVGCRWVPLEEEKDYE